MNEIQDPLKTSCYYETLGLSIDCNEEDIRKAYKKLAIKWHPDKNSDNREYATSVFQRISEAYQVLSDPEKRERYDNGEYNEDSQQEFYVDPFQIFQTTIGNIFFNHTIELNFGFSNIFDIIEESLTTHNDSNILYYYGSKNSHKNKYKEPKIYQHTYNKGIKSRNNKNKWYGSRRLGQAMEYSRKIKFLKTYP